MSLITNKCCYALKAMVELAKNEGKGPLSISEIASRQNIPNRFLEAILRQLKQGGLTDSLRGKEGGYVLSRSAKEIFVGEVIRLFQGPLSLITSDKTLLDGSCIAELSDSAESALSSVIDSVSFYALAERERSLSAEYIENYVI